MNLSEDQKDLLRLLVAKHESTGGAQFHYVRSSTGRGLVYPFGVSVSVNYDDIDFDRLSREDLITFITIDANQLRGKPTQRGVSLVRNDFALPGDVPLVSARQAGTTNSSANESTGTGTRDIKPPAPMLDTVRILKWMDEEGWRNGTLAKRLNTSERSISSVRNNGSYHGMDVITKLANLMGCDPNDLHLPEASS